MSGSRKAKKGRRTVSERRPKRQTTQHHKGFWVGSWPRKTNFLFFCNKGHYWDNQWNLNRACTLYSIVNFTFLILIIVLWLWKCMFLIFTNSRWSPGRVAQLVGVSSYTPRGCRFDSRSGHRPRLWVWSPVRVCTRYNWSMFLSYSSISLFLSFPLSLKSMNISSGEKFVKNFKKYIEVFRVGGIMSATYLYTVIREEKLFIVLYSRLSSCGLLFRLD